jgi:hypothetical protein
MANLTAPAPYAVFVTRGGKYTADANSLITATAQQDIQDLVAAGCEIVNPSSSAANNVSVGPSSLKIGANAGAAMDVTTAAWDVYIGTSAGATTTGGLENVGIGNGALKFVTTGVHNTGVGQQVLLTTTDGVSNSCFGADVMRNVAGTSNATAIGSDCMKYGYAAAGVAVGSQAMTGNSSNITVGGTSTALDTLRVTFTHASIVGSPLTISYTVAGGQSTTQMATGLAAAINASAPLTALISGPTGAAIGAYSNGNVVALLWAGTDLLGPLLPTVSVAVTGAATETLTLSGGPSGAGGNIAIGYKSMFGAGLTTAAGNIGIGTLALQALTTGTSNVAIGPSNSNALTTGTLNVAIGNGALNSATTGGENICIGSTAGNAQTTASGNVFVGSQSGALATGSTGQNTCFGYKAGNGITTGFGNVLIGPAAAAASSGQVTSGSNNVSIGSGVAVPTASANNQLCISNAIYGTTMSGTGTTISPGKIGIFVKAPAVELDVAGTINASVAHQTAGTQVVGARSTGWVAMTGTPDKGSTYDTSTVTLAQLAGRVMAMQAALTTHGLLGT